MRVDRKEEKRKNKKRRERKEESSKGDGDFLPSAAIGFKFE
jgi:hypothetical protein